MENTLANQTNSLIPEIKEKDVLSFLDLHGHSGLSKSKKDQFLKYSIMNGLNPFKREVYVVAYGNVFSIITGYEIYIKRAELSGRLKGWTSPIIKECKTAKVDGFGKVTFMDDIEAEITIYRKDFDQPFKHSVKLSEYIKKDRNGKVTEFWMRAESQLKKVAISQGFRLCFSEILGGMPYTNEEYQSGSPIDIDSFQDKKEESKPKINEAKPIEPKILKELIPTNEKVWENVFDAMTKEVDPVSFEEVQQKFILSEENKAEMTNQILDFHANKDQENV